MKKKYLIILLLLNFTNLIFAQDKFLGEIKIFAGNFAPKGWLKCEGQLLSISQNTALFSILGTSYGGDGRTTFGLPDLRERMAMGTGQGPLLRERYLGENGGTNLLPILVENLPAHTHNAELIVNNAAGTESIPRNLIGMANASDTFNNITRPVLKYNNATKNITLPNNRTSISGGTVPLDIRQPYLVCNYIIAIEGIYPQRQ